MRRDRSVVIPTRYVLEGAGIESRWVRRDFPHPSRPALGPTQPPTQWGTGSPHQGVKRPGRGVYYRHPSSVEFNHNVPRILYIGQTYRNSPQYAFYTFSQQMHLITFFKTFSRHRHLPQNVVYFLMLPLLVHKIFTFYINDVLNCKRPAPGPKG